MFEQAFQFHGKSFHRIRQMLPDKSIAALVKYYYRSVLGWTRVRSLQCDPSQLEEDPDPDQLDGQTGEEADLGEGGRDLWRGELPGAWQ